MTDIAKISTFFKKKIGLWSRDQYNIVSHTFEHTKNFLTLKYRDFDAEQKVKVMKISNNDDIIVGRNLATKFPKKSPLRQQSSPVPNVIVIQV